MTEKKKTAGEPTTFNVGTFVDQMREQNERFMAETEKTVQQVLTQGQKMFEETQKLMGAQVKMQQEWMESVMQSAKNVSAQK